MSRHGMSDERFRKAVFVSRQHPDDIDLLDALAHYSRADPFRVGGPTEAVDGVGARANNAPHDRAGSQ